MIKLKTYSEIFAGYSFRNSLNTNDLKKFGVLNLKDINNSLKEINYQNLSTTSEFTGSHRYLLQDRDILLVARGKTNEAMLFEMSKYDAHPVIPSGAFMVIRTMPEYLDPTYAVWYFNLPSSQSYLKRTQVGTTVQNLPIGVVQDFEINIPPLQKQQIIGKLYLLFQELGQLTRLRDEKYSQLIDEQLKGLL